MSKYKRLPKANWELFYELFRKLMNKTSLPIASPTQVGCVKIGEGLSMVGDTLVCTITPSISADDVIFENFTDQDVQDIFKEGYNNGI